MGGVFRAVASVFKGVSRAVTGKKKKKREQPEPVQPTTATTARTTQQRKAALGSGYGTSGQTIMTGTGGVEEQARTGRTLLGGG
jgi:hypothetical protein